MKPDAFVRDDGQRGAVVDRFTAGDGTPHAVVEFPDGIRFELPESLLPDAADGSSDAPALPRKDVEAGGGRIVIPVIAEQLAIEKRAVPRGIVRIHKRIESRDEVVEQPLLRQTVTVEHVPINKLVEGDPPAPRQEGDWTVIPIVEEVLVVEKRLMLVEEVRIARQEITVQEPQTVTLRREVVEVERLPADAASLPIEEPHVNGVSAAPRAASADDRETEERKTPEETKAGTVDAVDSDLPNAERDNPPHPPHGGSAWE
jgi:uncharacterized protein (TIGR02271 family)